MTPLSSLRTLANMPAFLMTYPAFLFATREESMECVKLRADCKLRALALFTDQDLAESFCWANYGAGSHCALVVSDEERLIRTLRRFEPQLALEGVIQVAFDPTPGKPVVTMMLRDFIEDLEESRD